jgi:hypothetical protein
VIPRRAVGTAGLVLVLIGTILVAAGWPLPGVLFVGAGLVTFWRAE